MQSYDIFEKEDWQGTTSIIKMMLPEMKSDMMSSVVTNPNKNKMQLASSESHLMDEATIPEHSKLGEFESELDLEIDVEKIEQYHLDVHHNVNVNFESQDGEQDDEQRFDVKLIQDDLKVDENQIKGEYNYMPDAVYIEDQTNA